MSEHPGISLASELRKRGWSQTDLAFVLGCQPQVISQIVNGKQGISAAMSKALGEALSMPPDHFAELQKTFELANTNAPDPAVALRAQLQARFPIREMIRRGWVASGEATILGQNLARFFEVNDANSIPLLAHAAKRTNHSEEITPLQLAWLYRVRQIARRMPAPKYSKRMLTDSLAHMRTLLVTPEEARHVPRILNDCGVRFIVVEPLPQSKIDGVCFWLDDQSPVIGLSMRFDRIDNFWFVVRHEIEHVLREDGRRQGMVDTELSGDQAGTGDDVPIEERIANGAAADFCVPAAKMESFIARKNPLFYERDILAFSRLNGVHPGLTVGQIQHYTKRHDFLKKYQVKIRQFVLPGARADGWGQVAMAEGA